MKMLITMMMMSLTGLTVMTTHPLVMKLIIIIQPMLIAMLTFILTGNLWFSDFN